MIFLWKFCTNTFKTTDKFEAKLLNRYGKRKESSIHHLLGILQNENNLKKGGKNVLLTAFSTERVQGVLEDFILLNQIDRVLFKKKRK